MIKIYGLMHFFLMKYQKYNFTKNKLIINCNEYKELYHLTINDLNKSLLFCYKKDFKINLDGQISKQTFLKCHSQKREKKIVYFF